MLLGLVACNLISLSRINRMGNCQHDRDNVTLTREKNTTLIGQTLSCDADVGGLGLNLISDFCTGQTS